MRTDIFFVRIEIYIIIKVFTGSNRSVVFHDLLAFWEIYCWNVGFDSKMLTNM